MAGARHGGAEAFFSRLVPALARAGIEQRALMRGDARRLESLRTAGVPALPLRFGGALDLLTRRRIRREIHAFRPQIVLSWMSRAASMSPPGDGSFVHCGRMGGYYDLKYYRQCDHLIGNTPDIVAYLTSAGWPADRAHYLPNFVAAERKPAADRAQHQTPAEAPLLLALGRLHENKAFDVLLAALADVPQAYLWLAGSGPLEAALKRQAAQLGLERRVRFLGWQDDPAPLYAAADVVVCPSRTEPLGNVVIEAWAQERPLVAAAAAGPRQLIEPGGNGLLAPIDDAAALAEALHRVLSEPGLAMRLAAGGLERYERSFTEAAVVAQYLRFFQEVAP